MSKFIQLYNPSAEDDGESAGTIILNIEKIDSVVIFDGRAPGKDWFGIGILVNGHQAAFSYYKKDSQIKDYKYIIDNLFPSTLH